MRVLFFLFALFALSYAQVSCSEFCTAANSTCPGLYTVGGKDVCSFICGMFPNPAGSNDDTEGDSVACRYNYLELANATSDPMQKALYCSYAGPLGGTSASYMCGDIYNFYCDALFTTLPVPCRSSGYGSLDECVVDARENIPSSGDFAIEPDANGDDIECRLTYVVQGMNSVLTGATYTQCDKAYWFGAKAGVDASLNCQNDTIPVAEAPCAAFCNAFHNTCHYDKNDEASFENFDDCMNACAAYGKETSLKDTKDTVGCRRNQIVLAANAEVSEKASFCDAAGAAMSAVCMGSAFGVAPLMGLVFALISFLFVL